MTTTSYALHASGTSGAFRRLPAPPDAPMFGAKPSTTVSISVEAGDVIVNATLEGKGPFAFILDTGGHAILTPEAARAIGLKTEGSGTSGGGGSARAKLSYTHVRRLRIGDVLVRAQPFLVIPYDNDFSDRGSKPRLAGILGLELFERFAIRIDYAHAKRR